MKYGPKMLFFSLTVLSIGCREAQPVRPDEGKPFVRIVSPSRNALLYDSTAIEIEATDDKGIASVQLYIDNLLTNEFDSPPYGTVWLFDTLSDNSLHLIVAKAWDADHNVSTSPLVPVIILKARPAEVKVLSLSPKKAVLTWADRSSSETQYVVQASNDGGTTFTTLASYGPNISRAEIFASFNPNTEYQFRVGARINESYSYSVPVSKICRAITFVKSIGGPSGESGADVRQTSDGGYVITGYTYSSGSGGADVYLLKTNEEGEVEWSKTFGNAGNDAGHSVQQTTDGGFIVSGGIKLASYFDDVYLIKTDSAGNTLWERTYGGNLIDVGSSVQQTADEGFIIGGSTMSVGAGRSDMYLIRTDAAGNKLWERTFGTSGNDYGNSTQQTSDGGFVIAGYTYADSAFFYETYIVKTDADGNKIWEKWHGTPAPDAAADIHQTSDGGYILTGSAGSDLYILRLDASGNKLWDRIYGAGSNKVGTAVRQTSDGGFVIAGYQLAPSGGAYDVLVMKTDAAGIRVWETTFGGAGHDVANSIRQTSDGGFVVTGFTNVPGNADDVFLIKLDPNGKTY